MRAWDSIQSQLNSASSVAFWSSQQFPVDSVGTGGDFASWLAMPLAKNIAVSEMPNSKWIHYCEQVLGVEKNVFLASAQECFDGIDECIPLCPSFSAEKWYNDRKLKLGFFDCDLRSMPDLFGRSFVYENLSTPDSLFCPISIEKIYEIGFKNAWQMLDRYGAGIVARKELSAQGKGFLHLKEFSALADLFAQKKQYDWFVPFVPRERIRFDFEIAVLVDSELPDGFSILGVVEQIVDGHFHKGAKSVKLDSTKEEQIKCSLLPWIERAIRSGFRRGVVGFDAFEVNDSKEVIVYDFNPCISQAFFPLLGSRCLAGHENQRDIFFRSEMLSLLPGMDFEELLEIDAKGWCRTKSPGRFPLFFGYWRPNQNFPGRTVLMTLHWGFEENEVLEMSEKWKEALKQKKTRTINIGF